ncbi:MAG: hypothetical protein LBN27_03615 [Prevotellaceae bacterium]|jgi:hypothetical protein|nr:hypothetical protein [Prevotellaceae bacterium]
MKNLTEKEVRLIAQNTGIIEECISTIERYLGGKPTPVTAIRELLKKISAANESTFEII